MTARDRWTAAAAEVTGQEVRDVVPLRAEGIWPLIVAGVFGLAIGLFLDELADLPGPRVLALVVAALALSAVLRIGRTTVFVVLTPTGLVVTSSTRWRVRPVVPLRGPLDPAHVSGPTGLLRNCYRVGAVRHLTRLRDRDRFAAMLAAGRVQPTP